MCSKFWSCYNKTQGNPDETNTIQMNQVFANCSEEDEIYPLTVKEIVEAQKADTKLKHLFKSNAVLDKGLELQIIENKSCICHKGRLVIHYLQHPGHNRLEETIKAAIYWKGMRNTIQSKMKSCKTCHVKKTYTKIWAFAT